MPTQNVVISYLGDTFRIYNLLALKIDINQLPGITRKHTQKFHTIQMCSMFRVGFIGLVLGLQCVITWLSAYPVVHWQDDEMLKHRFCSLQDSHVCGMLLCFVPGQ